MGIRQLELAQSSQQRDADHRLNVRVIEDADIPWMADLASRRYPPDFDIPAAELWVRKFVLKQPNQFLPIRTDRAFVVCMISAIPWSPTKPEANVVMCCAEDGKGWEAVELLRASQFWAKKRKCAEWRWRTATAYDIGPMARRVGATALPPCYAVKL